MSRAIRGARTIALVLAFSMIGLVAPSAAQVTGMVKGTVLDAKKQPVADAKVVITFKDAAGRKLETKSNKKGEYIQVGLQPGNYVVTASKEGVGAQTFDVTVRIGQTAEVNFELSPTTGGERPISTEEKQKIEQSTKVFGEGVEASKAGNTDLAIKKFTEAASMLPNCYECYYNIGLAHLRKPDLDQAEAAFKKAAEIQPGKADTYNRLAAIYSEQKKFSEAAEMSSKAAKLAGAAGGAQSAEQLFNQGVNLWNAGKYAEAKQVWAETVKLKPDYADAHYQLGLAALNTGDVATAATAFETYLKLAPEGKYAAEVKAMLPQLKK